MIDTISGHKLGKWCRDIAIHARYSAFVVFLSVSLSLLATHPLETITASGTFMKFSYLANTFHTRE